MARADGSGTRDEILAAALASGKTHRAAADAAGMSDRTVRRRLEAPEFRAMVSAQRMELVTQVADRLAGLAPQAVETMYSLLSDNNPPAVRCKAAQAVLSSSRAWRDASEMEARIRMLEALVARSTREEAP